MLQRSRRFKKWVELSSLQARLSIGVTLLATVSIGCMAAWMSWQTKQILVGRHIRQVTGVAEQIPQDVQRYQQALSFDEAIRKMSDLRSFSDMSVVVARDEKIITRSDRSAQNQWIADYLMTQMEPVIKAPETITTSIINLEGRDYLVCAGPLQPNQASPYGLYVFLDITEDRQRFGALMQSLGLATGLALLGLVGAVAFYVKRSLSPLRQMSQITAHLKVEELGHVQMKLDNAPTEVSELVKTCEDMLARLAAALDQQRQFTHDISHELRTPLTISYGYLQSLQRRGTNLKPPQREALETAITETEHSIAILEDLLNLARADSGTVEYSARDVSVPFLVKDVAHKVKAASRRAILVDTSELDQPPGQQGSEKMGLRKSKSSQASVESDALMVRVDPEKLRQVLVKLLDNALRYSDADQPIVLRVAQQNNNAIIQVCDRGIGIPLADQPRIFDRCYRVDAARNRATGGSGLGLSLVKTLVDGMGGRISVASQPNEGSTFTVSLPLVEYADETPHRGR
ncbi:MAG: sensor histidine kinase [Elainellaceae cyanobacterium]